LQTKFYVRLNLFSSFIKLDSLPEYRYLYKVISNLKHLPEFVMVLLLVPVPDTGAGTTPKTRRIAFLYRLRIRIVFNRDPDVNQDFSKIKSTTTVEFFKVEIKSHKS
jgi:hypothetical protein